VSSTEETLDVEAGSVGDDYAEIEETTTVDSEDIEETEGVEETIETEETEEQAEVAQAAAENDETWDTLQEWYLQLDDDTKRIVDQYSRQSNSKVFSALDSERKRAKELRKSLQTERRRLLKGTEEERSRADALSQTIKVLQTREKQREWEDGFYEQANKEGITNPKTVRAAMHTARSEGFVDDSGDVDWAMMRREYPIFFRVLSPRGNAGSGVSTPQRQPQSVNELMNIFVRGGLR
jgi:hypothetical protein